MDINWTEQLSSITQPPETIDEAVSRLVLILDDEQKLILAAMPEDDLIDLHFSLGSAIRNAFDLHNQDSTLLKSFGLPANTDDASMVIIKHLWKKLTQK